MNSYNAFGEQFGDRLNVPRPIKKDISQPGTPTIDEFLEFDFTPQDSSHLFEGLEEFEAANKAHSRAASRIPSCRESASESVDPVHTSLANPPMPMPPVRQPMMREARPAPARTPRKQKRSHADDIGDGSDDSSAESNYEDDEGECEAPRRQPTQGSAGSPDALIGLADLNAPLTTIVDPAEGKRMEAMLVALQTKMTSESKRLKGLDSSDRKRKRNRMASQISRLRKKLLVYELQRRYIEATEVNRSLVAENESLRSKLLNSQPHPEIVVSHPLSPSPSTALPAAGV
jgi:hypothetical protein